MYQPVGNVVFVVLPAVFERVSKFSVAIVPIDVSETLPVPVSARAVLKRTRFKEDPIGIAAAKLRTKKKTVQLLKRRAA